MTHADLIERAEQWLAGTRRCTVVLSNVGFQSEIVDAMGWVSRWSILVECKISVSDFHADKHKKCRQEGYLGIGQERYYLTPPGLLSVEQIPVGWGLLEAGKKMWVRKDMRPANGCWRTVPNEQRSINEIGLLVNHYSFGKSGARILSARDQRKQREEVWKLKRAVKDFKEATCRREA